MRGSAWRGGVLALLVSGTAAMAQQGHRYDLPHGYDPHGDEAHDHEFAGPALTTTIEIGLRLDRTYDSDAGAAGRRWQAFFEHTEAEFELRLTRQFALESTVKFEQVRDRGGDQLFEDHAAWIEQLFASFRQDGIGLFAGKLNPRFGIAWKRAPGVYGREFAEDYELTERIGLGASYTLDRPELGEHRLSASTFFLDTTALSESAFTRPRFGSEGTERPGRFRRSHGGVSNTERLSSFAVALEGVAMPFLPGFTYHLAYSDQDNGVDGTARERGYLAAATYRLDLSRTVAFYPLVEWARLRNAGGNPAVEDEATGDITNPKVERDYLTLSGQLVYAPEAGGAWNAAVSFTRRESELDGAGQPDDKLFQISAGYRFAFGLGIDLGWARIEEESEVNRSVGALITYNYEF